ncbi:MAG TPA: vitamin K epoxide reductase family protein [Candidatus Acidoferrales bacterium]|nr:vitamin K epoxide reductase family protein [Candidatus Acidoferrales bacterium]
MQALIACLALVGIYLSWYMLRKQIRAQRGELAEPSVVMTARAKAAGVPNSAFGIAYYLGVLVATPFLTTHLIWVAVFAASLLAAAFSLYLAYSLLFITRMPCAFCWTGHAINWILAIVLLIVR